MSTPTSAPASTPVDGAGSEGPRRRISTLARWFVVTSVLAAVAGVATLVLLDPPGLEPGTILAPGDRPGTWWACLTAPVACVLVLSALALLLVVLFRRGRGLAGLVAAVLTLVVAAVVTLVTVAVCASALPGLVERPGSVVVTVVVIAPDGARVLVLAGRDVLGVPMTTVYRPDGPLTWRPVVPQEMETTMTPDDGPCALTAPIPTPPGGTRTLTCGATRVHVSLP